MGRSVNRLHVHTRGIGSWRERLASPDTQWKRGCSALEAAVSWELASRCDSGLPDPVHRLLESGEHNNPLLLIGVSEHKVQLRGRGHDSQCDIWAVLRTSKGLLSLSVEAKARETFGDDKALREWLSGGDSEKSQANRTARWDYIKEHLPSGKDYDRVRYQILHRCAASVIEAKRLGLKHAAFIVQAFEAPERSFQDYATFCEAMGVNADRGRLPGMHVSEVSLSVGWADCPLASDAEIALAV